MSKDKKSKISTAPNEGISSHTSEVDLSANVKFEEKPEKPKDIHSIEIILDVIDNIKTSYQVSYIHVKTEYNGKTVDISEKSVVIDEKVKLNWSFYIDVDVLNDQDLDNLVSRPVIFTIYQTLGDFDQGYFKGMQLFEDVTQDSKTSFDSAISVYEAFTGVKVEDKEMMKENRKAKKKKNKSGDTTTSRDDLTSISSGKEKPKKKTGKGKKAEDAETRRTSSKTSQKTEYNSTAIAMGTMDMLPLVLGNQKFDASVDLKPLVAYDDDRMVTFKNIPKICVTVQLDRPIQFEIKPSILSFTVESIFNVPQVMFSQDMDCRVCAWMPLTDDFDRKQIFGNAAFSAEDIDYRMKAWANMPVIGDDVNTSKYRLRKELDNVRYSCSKSVESVIKRQNPKVVYNYIRRNILTKLNRTVLSNYLMRYRFLLIEILVTEKDVLPPLESPDATVRKLGGVSGKLEFKKKGKSVGFLHLMALVDISTLIYPGVTSTRVAVQLSTYHEKEVLEATGIKESFFSPKPRSAEAIRRNSEKSLKKVEGEKENGKVAKKRPNTPNTSSSKRGGHKSDRSGDADLKAALPSPPPPEVEEEPPRKIFNENGDPTVIIVEIEIDEPLVKARPAEELMTSLKELIPTKPTMSKATLSIKAVEENYQNIVKEISARLNEHYYDYMQEKENCQCSSQADFLTYLRRIGVYHKYNVTLRRAISVLISKKYEILDFSLRRSSKNHQDLLGKIFVYLVGKMNTVLNKQHCSNTSQFVGGLSSMDATLFYAKEACEIKQYTSAEKYFMERLCLQEDNPDAWFDYALFQIELDSPELAFEYLREALSKTLDHINSLLLYGILLTQKGKMSDAETCFMTVLVHRPRWLEGWGVLFLFYQKNHNPGGMTFAENMAKQYLNDERTDQDYFLKSDDLIWTSEILPRTIFFKTAVVLLKMRMYSWVEDALAFEIAAHPGKVNYLLAVICYFQEDYDHALDHLKQAKMIEGWNHAIVALTGHCLVWKHEYEAACEEFFYVINSYDIPYDMHMLYIGTTKVLSILGREQEARRIILLACKRCPTPYTWMVAGTFFYNENDLLSAEECFTEANICNNRIPEVWAFLTLINLKLDRAMEAELCYQQTLKNELDDPKLIASIKEEIVEFQRRNHDCEAQFTMGQDLL